MSISALTTLNVGPGLVGVRPVGGNLPSVISPFEFEGLQSCSFDIDQKIAEAFGQFKMSFDSAPVETSIKGTIETLVINGTVFSNIISGDSPSLSGNANSYRESYTLASTSIATLAATTAYTKGQIVTDATTIGVVITAGTTSSTTTLGTTLGAATTLGTAVIVSVCLDTGSPTHACAEIVANATVFAEDGNVMYATTNYQLGNLGGAQSLTPLPGPPAVGQYISAGTSGVYLFNATDGGSQVFISYQYTPSSALNNIYPLNNHWVGWGPYCEMNLQFPYQSVQTQVGGNVAAQITAALHLVAVRFGSMKSKTKRDGYTTVTYDWQAFCPPNGVAGQFYLPN